MSESTVGSRNSHLAQRQDFSPDAVAEFLKNGWLLALNHGEMLVGWGEWSVRADSGVGNSCGLFAPDFYFAAEAPWRFTPSWDLIERNVFSARLLQGLKTDEVGDDQPFAWVEPERGKFEKALQMIDEGMENRGLAKAVPVVFATASVIVDETRRARILTRLLQTSEPLFPYGFWSSSEGIIGATPEILFTMRSGTLTKLKTMALAGTREGKAGAAEVLLSDPKERHEHQLLIEDLREVLAPFGPVTLGETSTLELPTLVHLYTPISVNASGPISFTAAAKALHPTPALGVAPRRLGFEEIKRWDSSIPRHRFGAPFGAEFQTANGPAAHCLVAIRNIQWQGAKVTLGSGCGVVAASEPDREWQELQLKRNSVKRMLGV